ncbi:LOW QUALITY PROTEIN: V-type proton ATPase subunit S1-like protein [Rhynchonycteris naso]
MGRKILFSVSLIFLCMGFSLTLDQIFARKNVRRIWRKKLGGQGKRRIENISSGGNNRCGDLYEAGMETFTLARILALNYNMRKQGHLEKEPCNAFSHNSLGNVSMDEIPCILFWAQRIAIKFKNQIWLDLTEEAFSRKATVDANNSNCSEESAKLSLKFDDSGNPKSLDIRFTLTNYDKFTMQSWFNLHQVDIIFNNSTQATFNATGIYAPSSYSYHCQHVSSLKRYDALLLPSNMEDISSLWEVIFADFQIQALPTSGDSLPRPSWQRDCTSSFSPAIFIDVAVSLVLLLVLACLNLLIYLQYPEQHNDFVTLLVHLLPLRARGAREEKLLVRSRGGVLCNDTHRPARGHLTPIDPHVGI